MNCREVREYLPAYVEQAGGPRASDVEEHLTTCAGCRTELEQFRELDSLLGTLATETIGPPAWLLGTLTETVSEKAQRIAAIRSKRDQLSDPKIVVGGAILAAGVAGALVVRGITRRRRKGIARKLREALANA